MKRERKGSNRKKSVGKDSMDGIVKIDFDAGGPGLCVGPNPVRAVWANQDQNTVQVTWELRETRNTLEGWSVLLGNVIPCNFGQLPPGKLTSSPTDSGTLWTWKFPWDSASKAAVAIPYEIFVVYGPQDSSNSLDSSPSQPLLPPQLLGLREVTGLDPTVLLPPRQGPGPLIP